MINVKQTWLSEEPLAVKNLRKLPEGSRIPNFEPEEEVYLFLKIEGKGEDSQLVLLTYSGSDPIKEYYPLSEVKYFREDGQPDIVALPRGFARRKPLQEVLTHEDSERYCKMLNGASTK